MLSYPFMQKALFVGLLLGLVVPLTGIVVTSRRTSTIGDALSHVSLSGIALGLIAGVSPMATAIATCIFGALLIEWIRRRFPGSGDLATAIVMSAGIGLASVLMDFAPSATNFESYLFGSIIAITSAEVWMSVAVSLGVLCVFFYDERALLYITMDAQGARMSGIPVERVQFRFTVLLALTIAIASRIVGILMISSLMVLPVACARILAKSYRQMVLWSMALGVGFVFTGLSLSWGAALKPGGTIVLVSVGALLLLLLVKRWLSRWIL